MGNFHHLHRSL